MALEQADAIDWDGLQDALAPVRDLVFGDDPLITAEVYQRYRTVAASVLARVAPVRSQAPWAFLAVRTPQGVPRWMLVEQGHVQADVALITGRLRILLADDPPGVPFDEAAQEALSAALTAAGAAEVLLLPQRLRRALDQLRRVAARESTRATQTDTSQKWRALAALTEPDAGVDLRVVAEKWMVIVADRLTAARERPRQPFVLLAQIDGELEATPPTLDELENHLGDLPVVPALDQRVAAAIIGVPAG